MKDKYPLHIINVDGNVVGHEKIFIHLEVLIDENFLPQHFILRMIIINK